MIGGFFIGLASAIISLFAYLFSIPGQLFSIVFPPQIDESFAWFFERVMYWDSIFPISDLFLAMNWVINIWIVVYSIKLLLWIYKHLPFISGNASGELVAHKTSVTHHNADGSTITQTRATAKKINPKVLYR